jgi:hypothetical protein
VVTRTSRFEVGRAPLGAVRAAAVGFLVVVGGAAVLLAYTHGSVGLLPLALLVAWMAPPMRRALAEPQPPRIIAIIKSAVLGIILLDASFVAGTRGIALGAAVAVLFAPAYAVGRRFGSA